MALRVVYPDADHTHVDELDQPVAVDGSGYTEPIITTGGAFAYTAEDDSAAALQSDVLTIPDTAAATDHAIVVAAVTDETDTAQVATVPATSGINETQQITSDRTGGTFTITHDGNGPTGNLNADTATAGEVQTELEGLAHIAAGDVIVTGGPLPAPIDVEFAVSLGLSDQALMVITDSGTGGTLGVVAATTQEGGAATSFDALETDLNIPQAGANFQPQMHVWSLELTAAHRNQTIDVTHSDHGTNKSLGSVLAIVTNLDTTTPVEVIGTETAGDATFAQFGTATPLTTGAKALVILSKALDGAGVYYTGPDAPTAPEGLIGVVQALADAMTLDVFRSGVLDTNAFSPADTLWTTQALWASGILILNPSVAASILPALFNVVNAEDDSTWIDITSAAGRMNEVLELDLSSLPSDAIITSANVELRHSSSVRNPLRLRMVGINTDNSVAPAVEQQAAGYIPLPVGQFADVTTADWETVADGTPLSSFSRLGIQIISTQAHPFVSDHRIFWMRSRIQFDQGGPIVANVVGPTTAGDPITWDYSSGAGLPMNGYQVRVIVGAGQDPDTATTPANPLNAAAGEIVYDSGAVSSGLIESLVIADAPLGRGTHTVAVRVSAQTTTGRTVFSGWVTDDFDITGTPVAPGAQAVEPVFNLVTGGVDLSVDTPAGITRAWVLRSRDSGATFVLIEEGAFTVAPLTTVTLTDFNAPTQSTTLRYLVTFDNGAMNETDVPVVVGSGSDVDTPAGEWWLRVPSDSSLNTTIDVQTFDTDEPTRVQLAEQAGNVVAAISEPLATRITLRIRCTSGAQRLAIHAVARSGETIVLSDIWGRQWECQSIGGLAGDPTISKGNLSTAQPLRDFHTYTMQLIGKVLVE